MELPSPRGPLSRHVADALRGRVTLADIPVPQIDTTGSLLTDDDLQLTLWMLYELHYRGFAGVADEREWDPLLLTVRQALEAPFEAELRRATRERLAAVAPVDDVAAAVTALIDADTSPSVAAFLHRTATADQMRDYLRERSVQQLKESDPHSFVLGRLDGPAKVALAELQYDEYGAGRPDRLHALLYAQTLEAAGLDSTYGAYIDDISAVGLASANAMSLFALHRRLRGAAMGHLAVFEATSAVPCRKIAGGLARLGFPDAVTEYFTEHVVADSVHEHVALQDICGSLVAADPTLFDDVVFGAATCLLLDEVFADVMLARWTSSQQVHGELVGAS